ncbi:MAG: type III pantothenate kinase [Planctomycetia bacterium]|nr:type III pantothenate kinase [Planctomycetia bacterium]
MTPHEPFPLIAVDVGNSRVKFGLFDSAEARTDSSSNQCISRSLPHPVKTLDLDPRQGSWDALDAWLADTRADDFAWWIASVQRQVAAQLVERLRAADVRRITLVTSGDLPLKVEIPRPDMVGIDRLLGAVAANRLRDPQRPAVVVDLGTAITVDLISAEGAFRGGAILPGIGMSARALHQFTDLLPLIDMQSLAEPPAAVGNATVPAMTSGLYWGAVGGVKQLIELFARDSAGEPQVFLTGGAAQSVAKLLPGEARLVPDLVLSAIAIAAAK